MISIDFLSGHEWDERLPKPLAAEIVRADMTHRFAVIQNTYVEGFGEMVFDKELWLTLIEFVSSYDPEAQVYVTAKYQDIGRREVPLATYLNVWNLTTHEDRGAPACVALRKNRTPSLFMFHENWASIGGPYPYSDSHTYAFFSKRDLAGDLMAYLNASTNSVGWALSDTVLVPEPKPPLWRRLLNRLLI